MRKKVAKSYGKRGIALLAALVFIVSGSSIDTLRSSAKSDNLVINGDFEEVQSGEDGKQGLVGWIAKPVNQNNGSFGQEKKGGHDKACAEIQTDAVYGMDMSVESLIDVTSNGVYDFSYWAKISGDNSVLTPYIYYYNVEGGPASVPYSKLNVNAIGKQDWEKIEAEITIPDGVSKIGFSFILDANSSETTNASARIDDVRLTMTDETKQVLNASNNLSSQTAYDVRQLRMASAMRNAASTKLSCGFEDGDTAFSLSGAAEITTATKASGSKSLKTENSGYVTSPAIAVEKGKTYVVTAKFNAGTDSQAVFWSQQLYTFCQYRI